MTHSPNPMVPSTNWGEASDAFSQGLAPGRQVILCATCVAKDGVTTPPPEIVITGGRSYCLHHLPVEEM